MRRAGLILLLLLALLPAAGCSTRNAAATHARPFQPSADSLAFANETRWTYGHDEAGTWRAQRSAQPPTFSLRCFNMARMIRAFHLHADFQPDLEGLPPKEEALRVRELLRRNSTLPSADTARIPLPGHANLQEFSQKREAMLKQAVGGAWRSYLQRGNWRMVFPFSKRHQVNLATRLRAELERGGLPVVHVLRFPALTINHGLLVHAVADDGGRAVFQCVDPNQPGVAETLTFDPETRRFILSETPYFPGGRVDVYEIFRNWIY